MTYQEVLGFLYRQLPMYQRIGAKALNHDLGKTIEIHNRLSNPQNTFKTVHVAGNHGKGTTAHFLASILSEAGYKVGLYTSPHLKSFRERIKMNGEQVTEAFVVDFVEKNEALILELKPSFFEITVAMAYVYFAECKVDMAIIETGLGGRLDSTNIIIPEVSIITSIGLDHQDILGSTIAEIAMEKAGIIKESVPVVVGQLNEEAIQPIKRVANGKNAEFIIANDFYSARENGGLINISLNKKPFLTGIDCDLKGDSPLLNLPVVLKALDILKGKGFELNLNQLLRGIESVCRNTQFMGRWQILSSTPLVICDIGHNESAVEGLMKRLQQLNRPMHIVWGINADKAVDEILDRLPKEAKYYFCAAKIERALKAGKLKEKAQEHALNGQAYDSVGVAYHEALRQMDPSDVLFVGGSTFVVAELENL